MFRNPELVKAQRALNTIVKVLQHNDPGAAWYCIIKDEGPGEKDPIVRVRYGGYEMPGRRVLLSNNRGVALRASELAPWHEALADLAAIPYSVFADHVEPGPNNDLEPGELRFWVPGLHQGSWWR